MKKSIMTKLFAALAMTLGCTAAWAAQPEAGKVYRITNKAQGIAASDNGPGSSMTCNNISDSNTQLWLVEAGSGSGKYYFRSLGTGSYMQASNFQSKPWTVAAKNAGRTEMQVGGSDGAYTLRAAGSSELLSMHCDGQRVVVSWSVGNNESSMWKFVEVSKTQAEIDAALSVSDNMNAIVAKADEYAAALDVIFADKACTVLKPAYQSMTDQALEGDAAFGKLSDILKQMVRKARSGNWAETDPRNPDVKWDSEHALKYRVQNYEPFSEGLHAAEEIVGIQAYTNMNNPTGVLSDVGTVLYVMVDGEIKDGATLYMNGAVGLGMFNDTQAGVQLHEGLNVIPCYSDNAHQFIYYTVQTTKDGQRDPAHELTNYDDLKIHIEGGSINGFFNYKGDALYTPDTNDDWLYIRERARHDMMDLVGDYVILHFFFPDTPYNNGGSPQPGMKSLFAPAGKGTDWDLVAAMKVWDEMCLAERLVMGLQSDADILNNPDVIVEGRNPYEALEGDDIAPGDVWKYFNNRMMGITMQGDLYMNATYWRTAYNGNTVSDILKSIVKEAGPTWGPAHEYGHCNQAPMKIAGTTEISNNVFSNVAVFYREMTTSRSDPPRNMLNVFNQGKTFLENGIWGTTRMYLQLWLYYHYCGNNRKFYPRLYKLLKDNPRQQSYYLNHRYDALHFVKMCCIAAGEDLTPFFEAWGFFVPVENYHIGDYSNFMATLTPQDAQAVKDEIAALNLPVNYQIINIDDRPGSKRADWADYMAKADCGELGGLKDFIDKVQPQGELAFSLNGFSVEVDHSNGTGGTGFIILDNDGKLLGFSNDYNFPVSSECAAALIGGTAHVYALGADGTRKEVENSFANADASKRLEELRKLVETVKPELDRVDPTNTHVGYYMEFFAKPLAAAIAKAEAVTADSGTDEISEAYLNLITEYNKLLNHDHASVRLIPGGTYAIVNNVWDTRALFAVAATSSNPARLGNGLAKSVSKEQLGEWTLVVVDAALNKYKIKNVATGLYIAPGDKGERPTLVSSNKAAVFTVNEESRGVFTIYQGDDSGLAIHINTNGTSKSVAPVYVESHWEGSKWNLVLIEASGKGAAQANLRQLVAQTNDIMPLGGSIEVKGTAYPLTGESVTSNATYTGENEADRFTSFDVLFDGDINTYFHSAYGPGATTSIHYLSFDLGEGNATSSFQINWQTRNVDGGTAQVNAPTKVRLRGSENGKSWELITILDGCPSSASSSYVSPVIETEKPYRYIRMDVQESSSQNRWFVITELGINEAAIIAHTDPQHPAVTDKLLIDVYKSLQNATTVLASRDGDPSEKVCLEAYDELYPLYVALAEALGVEYNEIESSIDEILVGTENGSNGIYDLQGRRLRTVSGAGIYIIDGKKVLVK